MSTTTSIDPSSVLISALTTTMGVLGGSSGGTGGSSAWNIDNVLSTTGSTIGMGDGQQYWDETIQKSDIYASLQSMEPSQYDSQIHVIMKAMKYIFANMSKGRDVSDFYILMLKLINIHHYDVRKMVYIYLIQYANYNATTREMSLLSINSFQKGLSDIDPMIRALALRVLTSIQLNDIIPIQVLAITKHSKTDTSIHVRQCAIIAIAKLVSRIPPTTIPSLASSTMSPSRFQNENDQQRQVLFELIQHVLLHETSTALLGSAIIAFYEYCTHPAFSSLISSSNVKPNPQQQHMLHVSLYVLHKSYSKLCHLLCDFSEYVQVILIGDLLVRYCRLFFQEPYYHKENGSAYQIDIQRRVIRPTVMHHHTNGSATNIQPTSTPLRLNISSDLTNRSTTFQQQIESVPSILPPHSGRQSSVPTKPKTTTTIIKRRVVNKGFYSDEEDESTEEEIEITNNSSHATQKNTASGFLDTLTNQSNGIDSSSPDANFDTTNNNPFDIEEEDIHEDHKLLLKSVMPLLKSRNSGVVLAVCTLQYYCGVASIPIRKQIGQALVRVYKSNNKSSIEIQYVVLSSIRQLVQECPSAFIPYIQDFFILPNIDPNYTRMIKLDILTYLAIDPPSIVAVLNELRTYLHQINYYSYGDDNNMNSIDDIYFVSASIRAVGRIVENARIVYDRHAALLLLSSQAQNNVTGNEQIIQQYRNESNTIALNCLYGLLIFSRATAAGNSNMINTIISETILVLQRILQMLNSGTSYHDHSLDDPNNVRDQAFYRVLLLLVNTLSCVADDKGDGEEDDDIEDLSDDEEIGEYSTMRQKLEQHTCILPSVATASAMWLMGEYLMNKSKINTNGRIRDTENNSMTGKFTLNERRPTLCMELLRLIARSFLSLEPLEKEQAIHFASKMIISYHSATANSSDIVIANIIPISEHILALGRNDSIPDIRDRARFESALINCSIGLRFDTDTMDNYDNASIANKLMAIPDVEKVFSGSKPASTYLPVPVGNYSIFNNAISGNDSLSKEGLEGTFRFGTLSSLVGHKARSAYIPLPPWADKNSDASLRIAKDNRDNGVTNNAVGQNAFYRSSSDENSDSSSDSDESDDDETESQTDTEIEEDDGAEPRSSIHKASLSVPTLLQQQRLIAIESDSDETSSADDEDSEDDDSDDDASTTDKLFPNASVSITAAPLIQMNATNAPSGKSSVIDDMRGLVLDASTVPVESISGNDTYDTGGWMILVRSEHSGGLLIEGRYLRHRTKIEEAKKMGLVPPEKPTISCLQVRITNQKTSSAGSSTVIRHIRLMQHLSSAHRSPSTSIVCPRRMVIMPTEISELRVDQSALCMIGIDYMNASDRDGSYLAKVEMKYGSINSSISIDIKPSIGDMLLPYTRPISIIDFDTTIRRMQGFSRIESRFTVPNDPTTTRTRILERILLRVALAEVDRNVNNDGGSNLSHTVRYIALLPASLDPIYVLLSFDTNISGTTNTGMITVCCDHALVANSLVQLLKRLIIE